MCREEKLLGQKAEVEDDGGEEDEDEEEGGGTAAPAAAASAASDWLGGPYMLAWLKSLEKVNMQSKNEVADGGSSTKWAKGNQTKIQQILNIYLWPH